MYVCQSATYSIKYVHFIPLREWKWCYSVFYIYAVQKLPCCCQFAGKYARGLKKARLKRWSVCKEVFWHHIILEVRQSYRPCSKCCITTFKSLKNNCVTKLRFWLTLKAEGFPQAEVYFVGTLDWFQHTHTHTHPHTHTQTQTSYLVHTVPLWSLGDRYSDTSQFDHSNSLHSNNWDMTYTHSHLHKEIKIEINKNKH